MAVSSIKLLIQRYLAKSANSIGFRFNQPNKLFTRKAYLTNISEEDLSNLWLKMTLIYGQIFINNYGVKDTGIWFEKLNDLTPQALEVGIARLITLKNKERFFESPPNHMQFRALCFGFVVTYISPRLLNHGKGQTLK